MNKIGCILLLVIVIFTGCNRSSSLLEEVNFNHLNKEVRAFVDQFKDRNGIFLYSRVGEEEYFIVNYATIQQGEPKKFLEDIHAEIRGQVFTIIMNEQETSDLHDERLKKLFIYKLNKNQKTDSIQVIKNGKAIPIDSVGS
ncbi:hypothetical protein [Paenibacillus sp. YAF4_2]|uniref:hypothetical protein n=1 Tax=Paenibacillus sp. YAF4_2 TaxID=3233085 RepID=UPI003F9EA9D4